MDKKLVYKMIENCFKQYRRDFDSLPLSEKEYKELYQKILSIKKNEAAADLHEIINDVVYEYLTG